MRRLILAGSSLLIAASANAQWATFSDQTSSRLVASAGLVVDDNLEKDFAWGDFDHDGDTDLVCMRKFPGSIQGGFRDLLLMNEGGVLTDRTTEYGSASDVAGYSGMLDQCNDRDVEAFDVDNDGWLDLITCTTMSDQVNEILGQPRVYRNLGSNAQGQWLGFRFEDGRIPVLFAANGSAANPRFCDLAVGDFTGDGYVDLYFVDYDTPETSGTVCIDLNGNGSTADSGECQQSPGETASKDYQNKLLINQGNANRGYFTDSTTTRMTAGQLSSAFGNMCMADDFNQDGLMDIIRVSTLTGGQDAAILWNKLTGGVPGVAFNGPDSVYPGLAPYGMNTGDLTGDGKIDFVIADDSQDRYCINTGNGTDGQANFSLTVIADSVSEFGNSITITDMNNDGRRDVIITDIDADLPSFCPTSGRRTHVYQNTGNAAALLDENGFPIPQASLSALFDVAALDINGDNWVDLVTGGCGGIKVWMNSPLLGITWSLPSGAPTTLVPGQTTNVALTAAILGGGSVVPASAKLWHRIDGGTWAASALGQNSATSFTATLPGCNCGQQLDWYVSAQLSNGGTVQYTSPTTAPANFYSADAVDTLVTVYANDMEGATTGWTVTNNASLTTGAWAVGDPVGTTSGTSVAEPADDHTAAPGVKCWVTYPAPAGTSASSSDVDGGPTVLQSPDIAIGGQDVTISYARWFFCNDALVPAEVDTLLVELQVDAGPWRTVEATSTNSGTWVVRDTVLSTLNAPGQTLRVRFTVNDAGNNSLTESAIDDFVVSRPDCAAPSCPGDFDGDGVIGGADLGSLLGAWGTAGGDLTGDGATDGADLAGLLSAWGACP